MLSCLLPDPDVIVFDEVTLDKNNDQIVCMAAVASATAACPVCAQPSFRIHSSYQRKLADLPWAGVAVQIRLLARRFFCKNSVCQQKIFCERIPAVAAPWARRTKRLANAQQVVGLAAGGAGGARLCVALAMHAGIDLLLALIRNIQVPERATPRVLGVDDWAKRKGQTYGTILVDLERGEVVDILPDRTAESLEAWLKAHPGVEIVSRDRAGAYAQGARQGAPDAIQIADRWHLLKNLTDAIYKVLQKHRPAIERELAQQRGVSGVENRPAGLELSHACTDLAQPSAADLARQKRQQDAHRLHEQGWTNRAIAIQIGVCPKTVSRYLNAGLPSSPLRRSRRRQLIAPYRAYLIERWNAGCHNAAQLCREIQAQGFAGQYTIVRHFVSALRKASGLPPRIRNATGKTIRRDPTQRPPTLRMLAHLIGRPPDELDEREQEYIGRLDNIHPRLTEAVRLAREFANMVRQRQVEKLNFWLAKAKSSLLRRFATGLCQDYRAVRAALALPWSNGPTEGHINRLKCLKRQMYGRAKLDLLRQRLLAA
jgi:transposase